MPEENIEKLLRSAPQPPPPAKLKDQLVEQLELPPARRAASRPAVGQSWLRRWWPALAPGAVSLACAAVITMQQSEINTLESANDSLAKSAAGVQPTAAPQVIPVNAVLPPANAADGQQAEIARLRELVERLKSEVAQLEQVQAQNQQLRAELARPQANTPDQLEAAARERAMRIQCVNQMKQLGLAARIWALDNSNRYPEQVIFMTNEMGGPKILACPADTARQPASDWASWSPANCSYELLAPGAECDKDPNRVLFRCPIHGNVGLCDGSVQSLVAKDHPECLVERDGKLFYQPAPPTSAPGQ
jgi:hypothetical protein